MELVVLSSSPRVRDDFVVTPPCAQQQQRPLSMSPSSPMLPSPSALRRWRPAALKDGSHASQLPEGAITGFATAASLIRARRLSLDAGDESGKAQKATDTDTAKKTLKRPTSKPKLLAPVEAKPKPTRKPSTKKSNTKPGVTDNAAGGSILAVDAHEADQTTTVGHSGLVQDHAAAPVKPKKARARRDTAETQTKIKKTRVTKPKGNEGTAKSAAASTVEKAKGHKATEKVSSHFAGQDAFEIGEASGATVEAPVQDLQLEEAVRRRTDWTPTRDTAQASPSREISKGETTRGHLSSSEKPNSLSNVLANFSYDAAARKDAGQAPSAPLTKRRRIELVSPRIPIATATHGRQKEVSEAANESPAKQPKKKPRTITTITELATSDYRSTKPVDSATSVFFSPRAHGATDMPPPNAAQSNATKTAKVRKSDEKATKEGKSRTKSAPKSKKQVTLAASKLLSPETAMTRLNRQEVLFGTSSQLAQDASPTFIRQMQQAIHESEATAVDVVGTEASSRNLGSRLSRIAASRSLWRVAARDEDDGLFAAANSCPNDGSLEDRPPLPQEDGFTKIDTLVGGQKEKEQRDSDDFISIEDSILNHPVEEVPFDKSHHGKSSNPCDSDGFLNIDDSMLQRGPDIGSDLPEISTRWRTRTHVAEDGELGDIAMVYNMDGASDIQSPVCHTRRMALQPTTANPTLAPTVQAAPPETQKRTIITSPAKNARSKPTSTRDPTSTAPEPAPAKRPRGRPRKDANAAPTAKAPKKPARTKKAAATKASTPKKSSQSKFLDIDEIEDSEPELTPSPPRQRGRPRAKATSPTLDLLATPSPPKKSKTSNSAVRQPAVNGTGMPINLSALFSRITSTIKAAPPTTDPKKPSWHEKMLMYDPIVVEDLTAWLNEQGLRMQVGEDGQDLPLRPKVAQKWCEENSICCLWKESLAGGARVRY